MYDPLAPNPLIQGDPEANRRFAAALAAPAKFIVNALKRDTSNQRALGAVATPDQAQAAPADAAGIARALREAR